MFNLMTLISLDIDIMYYMHWLLCLSFRIFTDYLELRLCAHSEGNIRETFTNVMSPAEPFIVLRSNILQVNQMCYCDLICFFPSKKII
jgi:hypothetical protein